MSHFSLRFKTISLLIVIGLFLNGGPRQVFEANLQVKPHNALTTNQSTQSENANQIQFDTVLLDLQSVIHELDAQLSDGTLPSNAQLDEISALKSNLEREQEKVLIHFSEMEALLDDKTLSPEITQRQEQFVIGFQEKYRELEGYLDTVEKLALGASGVSGDAQMDMWQDAVRNLEAFLAEQPIATEQSTFDPNNLPHRSLRAENPIPPKVTEAEWEAWYLANIAPEKLTITAKPGNAIGSKTYLAPSLTPTPEDLAETIEVQFTPEITQLAADLNNNSVEIYNWVHDNIEFTPIWGSIQGAQHCLEVRICNAFDTSSLTIALLRVSGVPARYQMGTIEIPIDQFMNWAGGFTDPLAAASLFASSGVPSVIHKVDNLGQVFSVKLEHIWVKAFVDYAPSHGEINVDGDTWIEMDSSFKQYTFIEAQNIDDLYPETNVEFLAQLAIDSTFDNSTGSVTDINTVELESYLNQSVEQQQDFIMTNFSDENFVDVFGGKLIIENTLEILPPSIPYKVLVNGIEFSEIPDTLKHKITIHLNGNTSASANSELITYSANLAELAGKNVLLGYAPASDADEQIILSLVSAYAENSQSLSLPSTINFVAQIIIDGQIATSSPQLQLGTPTLLSFEFFSPTINTPAIQNHMLAGESAAIGLNLAGISNVQIQNLSEKSELSSERLEAADYENIGYGDLQEGYLSSSIISWFAQADFLNFLTSNNTNIITLRFPSAGIFFVKYEPNTVFGNVLSVEANRFNMDVDRDIVVSVPKDGDINNLTKISFLQGSMGSSGEVNIPLQLLSREDLELSGFGTTTLLKLANDEGIPIHTLNGTNMSTLQPLLTINEDDLIDIQNAINAGLEVTIPETPVSFNGNLVLGYIVKDPSSGSAAFIISDGIGDSTNGALIVGKSLEAEAVVAGTAVLSSAVFSAAALATISTAAAPILLSIAAGLLVIAGTMVGAAVFTLIISNNLGDNASIFELGPCALIFTLLTTAITYLGAAAILAVVAEVSFLGGVLSTVEVGAFLAMLDAASATTLLAGLCGTNTLPE